MDIANALALDGTRPEASITRLKAAIDSSFEEQLSAVAKLFDDHRCQLSRSIQDYCASTVDKADKVAARDQQKLVEELQRQLKTAMTYRKKCQQLEEKISVLQQDLTCLNKSALRIYEVVVGEGKVDHKASPTSKQSMTADMIEAVITTVLEGRQTQERLKEAVKKLQNHKEILKAEYKKEKKQRKQFEVQLRQSAMKSSNLPSNKTIAAWQADKKKDHGSVQNASVERPVHLDMPIDLEHLEPRDNQHMDNACGRPQEKHQAEGRFQPPREQAAACGRQTLGLNAREVTPQSSIAANNGITGARESPSRTPLWSELSAKQRAQPYIRTNGACSVAPPLPGERLEHGKRGRIKELRLDCLDMAPPQRSERPLVSEISSAVDAQGPVGNQREAQLCSPENERTRGDYNQFPNGAPERSCKRKTPDSESPENPRLARLRNGGLNLWHGRHERLGEEGGMPGCSPPQIQPDLSPAKSPKIRYDQFAVRKDDLGVQRPRHDATPQKIPRNISDRRYFKPGDPHVKANPASNEDIQGGQTTRSAQEGSTPDNLEQVQQQSEKACVRGSLAAIKSPSKGAAIPTSVFGVQETLHLLDDGQRLSNGYALAPKRPIKDRMPAIVEKLPTPPEPAPRITSPSAGPKEPTYKYREVVRKKADREKLTGYECPDCAGFYRAVESWGLADPNLRLPLCGHVKDKKLQAAAIDKMRQEGSRHRFRHKPPSTPPGFWKMGFGDSQDSVE